MTSGSMAYVLHVPLYAACHPLRVFVVHATRNGVGMQLHELSEAHSEAASESNINS